VATDLNIPFRWDTNQGDRLRWILIGTKWLKPFVETFHFLPTVKTVGYGVINTRESNENTITIKDSPIEGYTQFYLLLKNRRVIVNAYKTGDV